MQHLKHIIASDHVIQYIAICILQGDPLNIHPLINAVSTCTVFIRIVAAATINFSLAGVRLLIEGGSYSRTAFIYFGGIPFGPIRWYLVVID